MEFDIEVIYVFCRVVIFGCNFSSDFFGFVFFCISNNRYRVNK